ncbi:MULTISPECIES: hypothetical protein [unclassified Roseibium]|uniref:hypothetical protein n=1 Tax=unclassified Roseibium TaxID=2629323 RepID=UPI00317DB559
MSRLTNIILGAFGTALMAVFVLGLSQSISTGFAGILGGLPFTIIVLFVLGLALFNLWEDAFRKKD